MITTAPGPIEVAETGAGSPVLVVHGSAGGFDMGLQVGKEVLGDGYRVVAPSRFGYLRTPPCRPPDFIFDRLLASDLFAWTVVRLAPNLLVRVAGVPKALTAQVTAEDRQRILGWFFPAAARHVCDERSEDSSTRARPRRDAPGPTEAAAGTRP